MGEQLKYNVPFRICHWKLHHDRSVRKLTLALALALAFTFTLTLALGPSRRPSKLQVSARCFTRKQDNRAKASCLWGGRIDKASGALIGRNKLGEIWTQVRNEWRGADAHQRGRPVTRPGSRS